MAGMWVMNLVMVVVVWLHGPVCVAVVAWRSASRRRRKARKRAMFWSMDQHQFAMISTPDTLTRWRQKMMAEDEGQVKMLGGEMIVCSISVSNGR